MSYPRWIDRASRSNLREVASGLYVGALESPEHQDSRWYAVVNFSGGRSQPNTKIYKTFAFGDGGGFPPGSLDALLEILRHADGPVLIHCHAGLSRSVSAAYAMLVAHYGLDRRTALRRVKAHPDYPMAVTFTSADQWLRRKGL